MNELALFAGVGGGLLATKWMLGWRTVCYVEREPYCVDVLMARIRDGLLDDAPIWNDVRTFDGLPWRGAVDIVTAGFPCQPFSGAGLRLGELDPRNCWPNTIRIIRDVRPENVLLENVSRLVSNRYFGTVVGDLAASGYGVRWDCVPASAIGANHQRDRVFIVAHANGAGIRKQHIGAGEWNNKDEKNFVVADANLEGLSQQRIDETREANSIVGRGQNVSDPDTGRRPQQSHVEAREGALLCGSDIDRCNQAGYGRITWWEAEPRLGRVAHGVAHRVERLKAIGNGQVPGVVAAAWNLLR